MTVIAIIGCVFIAFVAHNDVVNRQSKVAAAAAVTAGLLWWAAVESPWASCGCSRLE